MWRVRQANGNLVTFRELTTRQRWIVERELSRDDEISLTGEKWKRLGDIGQLSSFFRVVDEAQRADPLVLPLREPGPEMREPSPAARLETTGSPRLGAGPNKGGPHRSLSLVLLLALLGGVSYLAYRYFIWVPQRQRQEQLETSRRSSAATPPQESPKADQLASPAALPPQAEALAGRGLALVDLGQTSQAIAAFEQALEIDPGFGLALMGLAEAYRAEGKKEQAMLYYEKYLTVVPDGPKAQAAKAAIKALQE